VTTETETRAAAGAVAQDILLVPRTVYVPYAAQVPVAPARLSAIAPGAAVRTTVTERRETEQTERREDALGASAADILQTLRALNERLDRLEKERLQAAPAAPTCPPSAGMPPCEPPGVKLPALRHR
jgi:hypothetical protein